MSQLVNEPEFHVKVEIGLRSVKAYDQKRGRRTYVYTDTPTCVRAVTKRRVVSSVREYTEEHDSGR